MGGKQSTEAPSPEIDLKQILKENTYFPETSAKYPYFLVQLSETEELEYKGALVSDAIVEYILEHDVTHIIAQTHGWNTPPDKAVAVPFTEFMGGMQNDAAMPQGEDFKPIFVAFIWPAVPIEFARSEDALTRAELLAQSEKDTVGEDTDIAKAAMAAKKAIEKEDPDDEELSNELKKLADASKLDSDDEDEDTDTKVQRLKDEAKQGGGNAVGGFLAGITKSVLDPFQNLVFGRLMARGQRTGKVMEKVLGKLMIANEGTTTKVCLMANSLGAHVLAGILNKPQTLPHKVHTVFFVQGAITCQLFKDGSKYAAIKESVAGPIICTHSDHDLMLKRIFEFFHGTAIGIDGFCIGDAVDMKSLDEAKSEPYKLPCGQWASVNGTRYVFSLQRREMHYCCDSVNPLAALTMRWLCRR